MRLHCSEKSLPRQGLSASVPRDEPALVLPCSSTASLRSVRLTKRPLLFMPRLTFAQRHLDPASRLVEILCGLIMVLTFTLGTNAAIGHDAGAARRILLGALGCNLAWGLIDGVMYAMNAVFERGRRARLVRAWQEGGESAARQFLSAEVEPRVAPLLSDEERTRLLETMLIVARHAPREHPRLILDDVLGALACCWLVFLTALPASLPFFFIQDAILAMRVSNGITLTLLFLAGYRWGAVSNVRPWKAGLAMLALGVVLVAIAIPLGG